MIASSSDISAKTGYSSTFFQKSLSSLNFVLGCVICLLVHFSEVTRQKAFLCKRRISGDFVDESVGVGSVCCGFFFFLN